MNLMRQTWRWFGPEDKVTLVMARQAGVEGIVTALHHIAPGEVWEVDEIQKRQRQVATAGDKEIGLAWEVVESLPVSEDIKLRANGCDRHYENYRNSLTNLAACGVKTVCYNFMPVLDWTRTDLAWRLPHGGTAMRFDIVDFALFDIYVLERANADQDYPADVLEAAKKLSKGLNAERSAELGANVLAGLPGTMESWTLEGVREQLQKYAGVTSADLRSNMQAWLEAVVPHAEKLGVRLCCHPDDPPFPLLGLPRIMSTEADYEALVQAVPSPANGITFCTGSLGARSDNDLPGMVQRLGPKIHFIHLRNVSRDADTVPCSFFEDDHLGGSSDMVAVVGALLDEQERRRSAGEEAVQIPMRPDHGQDILDDLGRGAQPGYPAIGRLKGLAELRGVMHALARRG